MQFSKMHGLGNDFMVIDGVTQSVFLTPDIIRQLSDRHRGIGFDQLLLVEPPYDPELDFHYRIFNADGSEVSQCGNGARCFARFVTLKGLTNKPNIHVSTAKGKMVLSLKEDGKVRVNMGEPIWEPAQVPFTANKFEKNYAALFLWVTHTVYYKSEILILLLCYNSVHCLKTTNASQNELTLALCKCSTEIISNSVFSNVVRAKHKPAAAVRVVRLPSALCKAY